MADFQSVLKKKGILEFIGIDELALIAPEGSCEATYMCLKHFDK